MLAQIAKADASAFEKIFHLYYRSLCRLAYDFTGETEAAKDIVSEVFVKLWSAHSALASVKDVRAFLYVSTKNASLNYVKASSRRKNRTEEMQRLAQVSDESLSYYLLERDLLQQLHEAVEQLPPRAREIFQLIWQDGLSTRDIALRLNISVQTVLNQKNIAIKILRERLLSKELLLLIAWICCQE